ncbi:MAG: phosphate signaling complex protein PhoU [Thermoanaerobaculia bacterium]
MPQSGLSTAARFANKKGVGIMTHYEKRLEEDLSAIRERIEEVGEQVETALERAVRSALKLDRALANQVVMGDKPINREIRAIDKLCYGFIARHLPSAGHLRFVSSVLRLDVELERIGDYAVAIAREAIQLSTVPSGSVASDIQLIADQAQRMFRQAMESFNTQNPELARGTKGMASQIESTYQKIFRDLLQEGEKGARPIRDLFATLVIFNRIGRVADQAKNICEDTLFAVAGETKSEKVYRVLFIDERNDALSQLAEAFARKAFPDSGVYQSAGWSPSDRLLPAAEVFMDARGLDGDTLTPKKLDQSLEQLADYHVIVALGKETLEKIEETPFHTVVLKWDIQPIPSDLDAERSTALMEEDFQSLQHAIRELMETLRGKGAS